MACVPPPDRERAVTEVAQAYERIKMQQPLLLNCSSFQPLAHSLLGEALRALNVALSVMNQQQNPAAALAEPPQLSPPTMSPGGCNDDSKAIGITARGGKRRRSSAMEGEGTGRSSSSWVSLTTVPYEDGYEWRKYGEKKINGANYTKSYFRCTYRDDTGCPATKQVQQQGGAAAAAAGSDAPMFQVTYINKHTCNSCGSSARMMPSTSSTPNGRAATSMKPAVKQETETPVPPPHRLMVVDDASALPLDQVPVPLLQQFCGGTALREQYGNDGAIAAPSSTATSPCISSESCDGAYSAGDMMPPMAAAEEAAAGHEDPSFDIDMDLDQLLEMYDSFKDY